MTYVDLQLTYVDPQLTYVDLQLTYVAPQLPHVLFHAVKTSLKARLSLFQVAHAVRKAIELAGKIHYPGQAEPQHPNKKRPNLQPADTCHVFHNFCVFPIIAATL